MYIANHAHSIVGMDTAAGQKEIQALLDHVCQPKYICSIQWDDPGDLGMFEQRYY